MSSSFLPGWEKLDTVE